MDDTGRFLYLSVIVLSGFCMEKIKLFFVILTMGDEKSRLLSFCLLRKGVNDENISRDWGDISGGAGKSRIYTGGLICLVSR